MKRVPIKMAWNFVSSNTDTLKPANHAFQSEKSGGIHLIPNYKNIQTKPHISTEWKA